MDEEERQRLLERERFQIQLIRQLDLEDLEVEEVDDSDSDSDSDSDESTYFLPPSSDGVAATSSDEFTFNTYIAPLHTYLGDVEDTRHRTTLLDGGAILNIPLFCLEGVVLFPGATLPLRVIQSHLVAAVEKALSESDIRNTIGVIRRYRDTASRRMKSVSIGTTAEIRQYGHMDDGSLNVVTRGQQRFRLRRSWHDAEGVPYGEIQIIDEDLPLRPPRDAFGKLAPLSNMPRSQATSYTFSKNEESDSQANSEESFESELSLMERKIHESAIGSSYVHDMMDESANKSDVNFMHKSDQEIRSSLDPGAGNCSTSGEQSSKEELNRCCKSTYAYPSHKISKAFLPHWAYRMFDSFWLAQRAADMWKRIVAVPSMDSLIQKPDVLSFHIASKIPVSESTRQELLEIDGIAYRLRREIELLESLDLIRCKCCQTIIAKRSDMLVMSSEGPLSAYVNLGGHVHEIMTLYKANGLALIGPAVAEYSWFPGYAWTIATCGTCETQMGWLFTARNQKLRPSSFWGIRSCQVAEEIRRNL
ncbi:protein cereblon isoform X2 [Abrus precatorius]|uniref:Protein cereblon n=1 Tax=Abrus precatorius TaxID=3816 RepID=A0A8B8LJB9_ABRPR|nr:protein cereblon isoform X2 [Abrus precatorius]